MNDMDIDFVFELCIDTLWYEWHNDDMFCVSAMGWHFHEWGDDPSSDKSTWTQAQLHPVSVGETGGLFQSVLLRQTLCD